MTATSASGKRTGKSHKYTLEEVEKITEGVDGVARCAVVVAAWTGLSLAELRGLKWEDIDFKSESLNVVRTVWHNEIIDTKTEHRAAAVPLLPNVISELKRHHEENPHTTWVLEGPRDFPLDLATLGSKRIKEALRGTAIQWYGFHAFRRGLGTRLYNNGTPLDLVGKILRHGSESEVMLRNYIDVEEKTKAAALRKLPRKTQNGANQVTEKWAPNTRFFRDTDFLHPELRVDFATQKLPSSKSRAIVGMVASSLTRAAINVPQGS